MRSALALVPYEPPPHETLLHMLAAIRCDTLLIRGSLSAILSDSAARETCAALRRPSLAIVPNAGHCVMLDNPVGFAMACAQWS